MKYDFPMIVPAIWVRMRDGFSRVVGRVRALWLSFWWGVNIGHGCRFQGRTIIRTRHRGDIVVGDSVVLNSDLRANLVGITNPTVLDVRGGGKIIIGDNSGATSVIIHSRSSVTIGSKVKIGGNVRIFDHDFHSLEPQYRTSNEDQDHIRTKPIVIGDACFIGTNAILLKGTELGDRTIVAAGSVVHGLKSPPDSLVKGNPAFIVRRYA